MSLFTYLSKNYKKHNEVTYSRSLYQCYLKYQNDFIHGPTKQQEYNKKKQQQSKMINELYSRKNKYKITDQLQINLFKIGSEQQKEQGITATENWIKLVKMTFEITKKKKHTNRQITEWMNRTNKYQEIFDTGLVIPV